MKTKHFIPLLLCFLFPSTGNIHAVNTTAVPETVINQNGPEGYEKIDLIGDLMLSAGPNAISAWVDGSTIRISFSQNFGYVNIELSNASGSLYTTVVNTGVQQLVIIPIPEGENGPFTLWLSNNSGEASGDFD